MAICLSVCLFLSVSLPSLHFCTYTHNLIIWMHLINARFPHSLSILTDYNKSQNSTRGVNTHTHSNTDSIPCLPPHTHTDTHSIIQCIESHFIRYSKGSHCKIQQHSRQSVVRHTWVVGGGGVTGGGGLFYGHDVGCYNRSVMWLNRATSVWPLCQSFFCVCYLKSINS